MLEADLLGKPENEVKRRGESKLSRFGAKELVKGSQRKRPGVPEDDPNHQGFIYHPERPFALGVYKTVSKMLAEQGFRGELRYYTALYSELDHFHHTDAFFEFDVPGGKTHEVTIDCSFRDKEQLKADILLHVTNEQLEDRKEFVLLIIDTADSIVNKFREKIQNTERRAA